MMRNLGGAVGIAVCGAILNNRTNFHFQAIAVEPDAGQRRDDETRERGRPALRRDPRQSASRP